ncbi:MAG: glycosyltransferase, partial [Opitutaceae bacterium]
LVVKVQNPVGNETDLATLRADLADLPDCVLLTETLTRREVYELESACDCFVSLHRAEGFGLAVAECMYLGKPVISTNWSATAEFLNADNGCPVNCRVVALERNHGPYMKGSRWADPDVEHAAGWMRKLFADRALAARIGAAARATIERRFSPAVIGARYRARLEAIAWF